LVDWGSTNGGFQITGNAQWQVYGETNQTALTITPYGSNVILAWPTNATDFTLQSTTNLGSLAVWGTISPGPVVIGGENVVFCPFTGNQMFFRLSK